MKKALLLIALAVVAAIQGAVYWNAHLFERARRTALSAPEKAETLELAARVYPGNERVFLELGRAYFERGAEALGAAGPRDAAFGRSLRAFLKALRLQPASAEAHIGLAQTLQYMNWLALSTPIPYFEEFKKAAALTGHNSQVYYEVGKVLLGRWESLRPEERDFALEILRKSLAGKDPERLRDLLEVWNLHGRDEAVIDRVLPADPAMLRGYARFLGEKSLSLAARERALSRAEFLDFEKARNELEQARRGYEYFQNEESATRLVSCLALLKSIVFFQALTREELFDPREFAGVFKEAYLLLAKSRIERTGTLDDPDSAMESYLRLEDEPLAVGEFETFLKERGLLGGDDAPGSRPKDLRTLAFELRLGYKQNRYRDITKAGEALEKSALIIPESGRADYARILGLVGDSFMKLDYLYEAERYYLKALSVGPESLEGLVRLERCYERLTSDRKLEEVRQRLAGLMSPGAIELGGQPLRPGSPFAIDLVCDGRPLTATVVFEGFEQGGRPLVTALWNGRVVCDEYAEGGQLSFRVRPAAGANSLVLETSNVSVTLVRLTLSAAPAGE
jgi:tetratricopeptide (TPR) repeat protein